MNQPDKAKAGDVVFHPGTGEHWVVAGVFPNGDILCAGWPCSLAKVGEYEITERCSPEEHEKMIRDCAAMGSFFDSSSYCDPRKSLAMEILRQRKENQGVSH